MTVVLTSTDYRDLELSLKEQNDPQQYLLNYNVNSNSFRFSIQNKRQISFSKNRSYIQGRQSGACNYKITTRIHKQCFLFSIYSFGRKNPSVSKLNCILNTTTYTARTTNSHELVQSLLQLNKKKNQLSLIQCLRDGKKSLFSEYYINLMSFHKFVMAYISFLDCVYFT